MSSKIQADEISAIMKERIDAFELNAVVQCSGILHVSMDSRDLEQIIKEHHSKQKLLLEKESTNRSFGNKYIKRKYR